MVYVGKKIDKQDSVSFIIARLQIFVAFLLNHCIFWTVLSNSMFPKKFEYYF